MMKEPGPQRAHQTAYVFLVCKRSQTAAEKIAALAGFRTLY